MAFTTSYNENFGNKSSWSNNAIKSPVANFIHSFVFPAIPLFSSSALYLILSSLLIISLSPSLSSGLPC